MENPMDRGAWWATVHGVTESEKTEQLGMHAHTSFQRAGQESLNTSPRGPGFRRKYAAAFGSYK